VDGINPSLQERCDIYGEHGSFRECLKICCPSYCCVHDAPRDNDVITPSCLDDENCPQYSFCSVIWWKFADTAGPAIYFNLEQDNAFFDMTNEDITTAGLGLVSDVMDFNIDLIDLEGDPYNFFNQLLLHNFHKKSKIIKYGTKINTTDFSTETLFNNKKSWVGTRRKRPIACENQKKKKKCKKADCCKWKKKKCNSVVGTGVCNEKEPSTPLPSHKPSAIPTCSDDDCSRDKPTRPI